MLLHNEINIAMSLLEIHEYQASSEAWELGRASRAVYDAPGGARTSPDAITEPVQYFTTTFELNTEPINMQSNVI